MATNFQHRIDWPEHARATRSVERLAALQTMVDPPGSLSAAADALLRAPLFQTRYLRGYGTLYGAVYQPQSGGVELLWRDRRWLTSLQSLQDGLREVVYTADESDAER